VTLGQLQQGGVAGGPPLGDQDPGRRDARGLDGGGAEPEVQ
jgi:hypothetical protein